MQEITKSKCVAGEEEDVELALLEAVGNAVIHDNLENPEKEVYIHCRSRKCGGLLIAVKDEGTGLTQENGRTIPRRTEIPSMAGEFS
jgi:serine/threonine-protein kinase RsbW